MKETWTPAQLKVEFDYQMEERLGLDIGTADPTDEQLVTAMNLADEVCEKLKRQSEPDQPQRRKIELD